MYLRLLRWSIQSRYLRRTIRVSWRKTKRILGGAIGSVPRLRALFLVGGVFVISVFVQVGFGVQAVNPMTEAGHAITWFTLAAMYAGVAVVVLEHIRPPKLWARCVVIAACEVAIVLGYLLAVNWVMAKANESAWNQMSKDARDGKVLALQYKWYREQKTTTASVVQPDHPNPSVVYLPMATVTKPRPALPPPAPLVAVAVSTVDDKTNNITYNLSYGTQAKSWTDVISNCDPSIKCYPEQNIPNNPIPFNVGPKGWGRVIFTVFNIGEVVVKNPSISVSLGTGKTGVSIDRPSQHQPSNSGHVLLEYSSKETLDIVPFSKTHTGTDFAADITVAPDIKGFVILFRIWSETLESHVVSVYFQVVRDNQAAIKCLYSTCGASSILSSVSRNRYGFLRPLKRNSISSRGSSETWAAAL